MPIIDNFFGRRFGFGADFFHLELIHNVVHFIGKFLGKFIESDFGIFIGVLFAIKGKEVFIFGGRYHGFVSDIFVLNVYQPGSKEFKIKMKVNKFLFFLEIIRYNESELLFIPSLTNPAYILKQFRRSSGVGSF